jgi:hypothetical protein
MTTPPWLVKGAWIEFAFCVGRIVDIAISEERVMVLVESPKGIWRNHPAEWLEYKPDAIKPATPDRITRDFELYRAHIADMARALDAMQAQAFSNIAISYAKTH